MAKHVGTDFDTFLAEEQLLEEVTAEALKRVEAWKKSQSGRRVVPESVADTEAG